MSRTIVRIRDCRISYFVTLDKKVFNGTPIENIGHIKALANTLFPGLELYISYGRDYKAYLSYEEILNYIHNEDCGYDDAIDTLLGRIIK